MNIEGDKRYDQFLRIFSDCIFKKSGLEKSMQNPEPEIQCTEPKKQQSHDYGLQRRKLRGETDPPLPQTSTGWSFTAMALHWCLIVKI